MKKTLVLDLRSFLHDFPNLTNKYNHTVMRQVFDSKDLETKFGGVKGYVFGLGYHLIQINYFRLHCYSKTYKNLYFVGLSNQPGTIISLFLNNAKLVVEEIDKHI